MRLFFCCFWCDKILYKGKRLSGRKPKRSRKAGYGYALGIEETCRTGHLVRVSGTNLFFISALYVWEPYGSARVSKPNIFIIKNGMSCISSSFCWEYYGCFITEIVLLYQSKLIVTKRAINSFNKVGRTHWMRTVYFFV